LWFAIRDQIKEAGNPYGRMFRYGPRRLSYEVSYTDISTTTAFK
jgi:hypothetical protein